MKKTIAQYLKTLRRLPDDVVLDLATRELELFSPSRCVCGWAVRLGLAQAAGVPAKDELDTFEYHGMLPVCGTVASMVELYGGTIDEWADIFSGVTEEREMPVIELALVKRVLEAVNA